MNKDIKIGRLERRLATANNDLKAANAEIRKLKKELKNTAKKGHTTGSSDERTVILAFKSIKRYVYENLVIKMALMLCVFSKISPRKVERALQVFNFMLGNVLGDIPEHTTIRTWIAKSGVDVMSNKKIGIEEAYALVVDGSISVGDQQMMLALKVPADHNGKTALNHADAEVVGMQVEKNWKAEDVEVFIQGVADNQQHSPEYCITDNGANLKKAIADLGIPHHRDISHTFATFLKAVYNEDAEFKQFSKSVGKTKHLALRCCLSYAMQAKNHSPIYECVPYGQLGIKGSGQRVQFYGKGKDALFVCHKECQSC